MARKKTDGLDALLAENPKEGLGCMTCRLYPEGSPVHEAVERWIERRRAGTTIMGLRTLHRKWLAPELKYRFGKDALRNHVVRCLHAEDAL